MKLYTALEHPKPTQNSMSAYANPQELAHSGPQTTTYRLSNEAGRNAYEQSNLVSRKASYLAPIVLNSFAGARSLSICKANTGGYFQVTVGSASHHFVGDIKTSPNPKLRRLSRDEFRTLLVPDTGNASSDTRSSDTGNGMTVEAPTTTYCGTPIASDCFLIKNQTVLGGSVSGAKAYSDSAARLVFAKKSGVIFACTESNDRAGIDQADRTAHKVFDGTSEGMSFVGSAIKPDTRDKLWVVDFGINPQIREFNKYWQLVPTQGFINPFATGAWHDEMNNDLGRKARPADPVPFNIHVVDDRVFVTYCISRAHKDACGGITNAETFLVGQEDCLDAAAEQKARAIPHRGKLVEFTVSGELVRVYDDGGRLNAPWGVAIAPANFGAFSNMLLIGNSGGAGKIAAFDQATGGFVDFLRDPRGNVLGLGRLWGLTFGNGESAGDINALYFASSCDRGGNSIFGSLRYAERLR
jgi:hypothetical protein